ncbi:MAG: response regulator transcription factor [Wujia sp.]
MSKIAIVDDDIYIGDMVEKLLTKNNYQVMRAYSGTEALMLFEREKPDLILLDLMLPGLSGEELLPRITDIPVIVVSAKVDITDKVSVLMAGAADYLTKPFDNQELLARISVQLRKASVKKDSRLRVMDLTLDLDMHTVTVGETLVHLTKTEYAILKLLMQNENRVVTKSNLLDKISEDTPDCVDSSLKVHISNLRRKLKQINDKDYIEAVWGIGFKLGNG